MYVVLRLLIYLLKNALFNLNLPPFGGEDIKE